MCQCLCLIFVHILFAAAAEWPIWHFNFYRGGRGVADPAFLFLSWWPRVTENGNQGGAPNYNRKRKPGGVQCVSVYDWEGPAWKTKILCAHIIILLTTILKVDAKLFYFFFNHISYK